MAYTDVFGGALLFPSQLSYLQITTAVDIELQWPREQQIEGTNVVADFLDIATTVANLNVDMPDARNTSTGNKTTINNIGGEDFTLRDNTGGTIQFIGQGEQWVIVLTDNSTQAGTWSSFQLGAATTFASASALAGAGLQADGFGLLEQIIASDVEAATPFDVVTGDRAKCLIYTAGAGTCNLQSQNDNFFCAIRNSGSGTLNIVPASGQIDGASDINLDPDGSTIIFTDGTDWYTIGLTVASVIAFDFVSIAVPGSGDFILTGANLNRISYRFTGALTGNRRIVVPNTTQQYWVDNQTSGAFDLEVSTNAGSGQTIPQGESAITYCDATDVINAVSSTSVTFPITVGQGGTSATNAADARTNLSAAFDGRLLSTPATGGLQGGGDLTADRTIIIDISGVPTATPDTAADFFIFQDADDGDATKKALLSEIGITIEDEGAPLAGVATTLDFVGALVTASGGGSTKTITVDYAFPIAIPDNDEIQWGTGNDVQQFYDGSTLRFEGDSDVIFDGNTANAHQIVVTNTVRGVALEIDASGNGRINETFNTGGFVATYIDLLQANSQVLLGYGNVPVARTAPVSGAAYPYRDTTGAWLVNNNTTGTGNSERALTYTDHMMVGGLQDDRNLTNAFADDNRLVAEATNRQGYWKFEIFCAFTKIGGTANIEFDFDSDANISECRYVYDYSSEDGTPNGSGAADDKTTASAVTLGSASEDVMVRIVGQFRMSANGNFGFRWRPTVSQLDTVSRVRGAWMTMSPIEIGV